MKQINPPFKFGDSTRWRDLSVTVLRCEADAHGWDVLVTPDDGNDTFWTGSQQLLPAVPVTA